MLYGWNDLADYQTDQRNPRKGNLLFGAKLSLEELRRLPPVLALVQGPFLVAFCWIIGPKFLVWVAAMLLVNAAYNWPDSGLKGRPGWDLLCQSGYLLVFVLSSWLNGVPQLPWQAFLFGALFAMHSHLFHEITDIAPDEAAGRRTTAVAIGAAWSKLIVAAMLLMEAVIIAVSFKSPIVVGFLSLSSAGFLLDCLVRRDKIISEAGLRAVLLAWNLVVLLSMYWVWREAMFVELR